MSTTNTDTDFSIIMEGEEESSKTPHFDDVFKYIGSCNRYFLASCAIVSLCVTSTGWNSLAIVFLFPEVDFWCNVDELNEQCLQLNLTESECQHLKQENRPPDETNTPINENYCNQYNFTNYGYNSSELSMGNSTVSCRNGYEFDTTQYKTSVTQEFGLVCEDAYLISLVQSLTYVGILMGAWIFGNASDRFGRKQSLVLCMMMCIILHVVSLLSQWYWMFVTFQTLSKLFLQGVYIVTFVIGCEFVDPSKRSLAGTFISFQWSIGYALASLYAYLIPYWRYLILAMAVTDVFILLAVVLVVPESPRWLHSTNEIEKAMAILERACKFSKSPEENINFCRQICTQITPEISEKTEKSKALALLRMKNLRKRVIIVSSIWFVNAMVYYGISISAVNFGSNAYIFNVAAGLVEIAAVILCWFAIERMGRRIILSGTMMLAGIACAATSFLSNYVLAATCGIIGKFSITASFTIIYIVAAEIFPTPIRTTSLGLSSMIGNVGAIIAPQILFLGFVLEQVPYLIFGILSLIAGIVTLLLPETKGLNLPHTLEEGENLE